MSGHPKDERFSSSEELMKYLRERVDDIDSVVIPVQEEVQVTGPGWSERWRNIGAIIKMCDGTKRGISRDDAATLINDGVLQRMRIKCVVDPMNRS